MQNPDTGFAKIMTDFMHDFLAFRPKLMIRFVQEFNTLRNTVMALPNLSRRGVIGGAAALAVVLPMAFGSAALAEEQKPTVRYTSAQEVDVPVRDARGIERAAIQSATARVSKDSQTVVLFGPTNESFAEVEQGLQNVLFRQSTALNGLVIASGSPELAFYANGTLTATILNPSGEDLSNLVEKQLESDYAGYIAHLKTAAVSAPSAEKN